MSIEGQTIGMAGAVLAAQQALAIARTGRAPPAGSTLVLNATLKIDADSPLDVYGGRTGIAPALANLREFMQGDERDPILVRTLLALMVLERNFAARADLALQVAEGVRGAIAFLERTTAPVTDAVPRLGDLYANTISHLVPRIMIPGDPELLARPDVVTAVRAHLLAALRGTVLWRQSGGSRFNVWFRWRSIAQETDRLLGGN